MQDASLSFEAKKNKYMELRKEYHNLKIKKEKYEKSLENDD